MIPFMSLNVEIDRLGRRRKVKDSEVWRDLGKFNILYSLIDSSYRRNFQSSSHFTNIC